MKKKITDVQLIFGDLTDTVEALKNEKNSPVSVRRLVRSFIVLSQQLTESMRKEFKDLTGDKWEAQFFPEWNDVTILFRKLRRSDYHEYPVIIDVQETKIFAVKDIFEDDINSGEVALQGTWALGDPFSEHVPDGWKLILADPVTGRPSQKTVDPKRRHYIFVFRPRTEEIEKAFEKVGTRDVHQLVYMCYKTLSEYFDYYQGYLQKVVDRRA